MKWCFSCLLIAFCIAAQAQTWQSVNVPSQATKVFFVECDKKGNLYIADLGAGFFMSRDNGNTWTNITGNISPTTGWTINVNPSNGDLIASTKILGGDKSAAKDSRRSTAVYWRSTNRGKSWKEIKLATGVHIAQLPLSSGVAFTPDGNAVLGGYWSPHPFGFYLLPLGSDNASQAKANPIGTAVFSMAYSPITNDLWAGTEVNGIYRSTDGGATWNKTGKPSGDIYNITFNKSGDVLAVTTGASPGVHLSTDKGVTWTKVFKTKWEAGFPWVLDHDSSYNLYYATRQPKNPNSHLVYQSTDGGHNWNIYDSGLPAGLVDPTHFAQNPVTGKMYLSAGSKGLYVTVNVSRR